MCRHGYCAWGVGRIRGGFSVVPAVSAIMMGALLALVTIQPAQGQRVLFHGSAASATAGDDGAVLAHLESVFGAQNVTYMQAAAAAADGSSANGFDAIVVSATTNSGDLLKYADTPLGVLNWEQALTRDDRAGEYFLSQGGGTAGGQTQIDIVDPSHPLAAGLSGTVTVLSSPHTMSFGNGGLGAGVSLVASLTSNPANHAIMAADVNDPLLGNGAPGRPRVAPGRRMMFFLQDTGFTDLTNEGMQLFNTALDFVVGTGPPLPFQLNGAGKIEVNNEVQFEATIENLVTGPVDNPPGVLRAERFDRNINTSADWLSLADVPVSEGFIRAPILWGSGRDTPRFYPEAFGFADPTANQDNYAVRVTGEMLIPTDVIRFRDGNDDYTGLRIDLNGDGSLDDESFLIDDNAWTDENGDASPGAPVAEVTFTNLTPGDDWRRFEFLMAEGGGDDFGVLVWDWNDTNGSFPAGVGDVGTATHNVNNGDDLVPASHLRALGTVNDATISFDAVLRLADIRGVFSFDVDVAQLEWDKIGMSIPPQIGNNTPDSATLDLDGVTINVNLTEDPVDGLVVDLIDNAGITQIVGTPTFNFSHGDPADWDTSMFTVNGQLTFGGAPVGGIAGDYNNSGQVEQGDLDLVLLNWGDALGAPWVTGIVDQAELDTVLLNWGNTAALAGAAGVPEPSTIMLLILAAGVALSRCRVGRKLVASLAALACLVGWSVQSSLAQTDVGGAGVIRKVHITGEKENVVTTAAADNGRGILFAERYNSPNFSSWANVEAWRAANAPAISGFIDAPPLWDSDDLGARPYPPALGFPQSNQDNYGVYITGEILIPMNGFIDFRDGIDDQTVFIVDEDGDGSLDNNTPIIEDTVWTNISGTSNNGGIGGNSTFFASFTNVNEAAGGSWRKFVLTMDEGGGGDRISIAWSVGDDDLSLSPGIEGLATGGFKLNEGDDLIPGDHFRSPGAMIEESFDSVLNFRAGATFEVNVEEREWDRLASVAHNTTADVTYIVDFSGGVLTLDLSSDPVPGLVVDLVNDSAFVDEIRGPASFAFSHGDPALWNTSNFTTNGQISFGGAAAPVLTGDFNASGSVDQGDLDLVLLNWGQSGNDLPQGWVTNAPVGNIDQSELDAVLLNWGATAALNGGTGGVPEPSTVVLALLAAGLVFGLIRRK